MLLVGGRLENLPHVVAVFFHGRSSPKPRLTVDVAALQRDVETLKGKAPDQAHAMKDVDHHFTNPWFAAGAENWPLAEFYWKETVSHMRWAVRIIPVRKDSAGREIKLKEIFDPNATWPK